MNRSEAKVDAVKIVVLHGPNLNLLGRREPEVYGSTTLPQVDASLHALAEELAIEIETFQSNLEGELIDRIQAAADAADGFLVNLGGYTHTSVALRDALIGVGRPYVEVHVSNVHARERFRRKSLIAEGAVGVVAGFGPESYRLGLRGLVARLDT